MKTLHLLRHAKSDWGTGVDDHDRPLAPRGQRAAALVGAYLEQRPAPPTLALSSTARRAVETLERVLAQLGNPPEVAFDRALYLAEPDAILERVRAVDERHGSLLVVGHNPGIGDLAAALAGHGEPTAIARLRRKFPTAAVAELELERWATAAPPATLGAYRVPKDLV